MSKVRKAVITAAGRGTRMYPATTTVQKELFPLVDTDGYAKPTLQIIVEEALASGLDEVCIVANPANVDSLRSHFQAPSDRIRAGLGAKSWAVELADNLAAMSERISFVVQHQQEGYGHAVLQAREWVGGEPFVLLLGDHVYIGRDKRCVRQVVETFDSHAKPVATVAAVDENVLGRVGVVRGEPLAGQPRSWKVTAMAEKPTLSEAREHLRTPDLPDGKFLAFFGIQAFPSSIFDCLQELVDRDIRVKNEYQLTSAMALLLERTDEYLACGVDGERYDMGVPEGLIETQIALAMHSPYRVHAQKMFDETHGARTALQ